MTFDKIKKFLRSKILGVEDKKILSGYAEYCIKCNNKFIDGDNFIGAFYCNFIDLDFYGSRTADVYTMNEYVVCGTEKKRGVKNNAQEAAICYECFNNYVNNKEIVYDGHDQIITPNDFFKV